MKALPVCGACESDLRQERGEWVCLQSGCPLYGRSQLVVPDASPSNKAQRQDGRETR